ncbi:hypothetical protein PHAMO_290125 [Magnetospirillum molischianum DSM 120]|uniref:Uncharacterized protein n=1 Tax=Magnetospirillum molischianum DSM 120 TaxID=1150626 RepID=H8FTY0_MAGML|nr:hypothetical protein PHAMO_290125 [Magnetospirillum molischianum DSM 120]
MTPENARYIQLAEDLGGPLPEKRRRLLEMCLRMPDVRGAERDALVREYYRLLRSDRALAVIPTLPPDRNQFCQKRIT